MNRQEKVQEFSDKLKALIDEYLAGDPEMIAGLEMACAAHHNELLLMRVEVKVADTLMRIKNQLEAKRTIG